MGIPLLAALLIIAPLHSCAQMPDLDVSTCGSTTGCYFHPANCDTNSTCVYVATWGALTNPNISAVVARYQIWATEVEWAAILVSEDAFVGDDDVLVCQRAAPSTVLVKDMYIQQGASATVDDDDDKTDIQRIPDPPVQMEGTTFSEKTYIYCQLDRLFMGKSTTRDRDLATPYFYLFAVGQNSNTSVDATSPVPMDQSNVLDVSPRKKRAVDYDNVTVVFPDLTLIKVHASFVLFTWLFLIPVGIMISSFFKIVWPNGGWFFTHIVIMVVALLFAIGGFITTFEHARNGGLPKFLSDVSPLVTAHGVIGIIAFAFLCINPLIGLGKGDPNLWWRKYIFKPIHGTFGIFFVAVWGTTNLLLGMYRVVEIIHEADHWIIHTAIYFCGGTIGFTIIIMAAFNLYHIVYLKRVLDPNASIQLQEEDLSRVKIKDKIIAEKKAAVGTLGPSRDYIGRVIFLGVYVLLLLCLVAIVLGLFNFIPQREPKERSPGHPALL